MFSRRHLALLPVLLLVSLPVHAQTTPESFLGFKPGADYHLATYEQALGYFEKLAGETERMQLFDIGTTPMGRPMKLAVISSEDNMARLDRYKEISRKMSLVRGVSRDEAEKLAEEGKAVVWVDGGLHASECAPAQHMIQLAYDLVTGDDRETREIRDNVIALLVFPNPDGMTLLSEWYHSNLGTEFEISGMPWVYNKYVGHDNNRDSMYANLEETRNLMRVQYHEWFPEILLNHHQTAPFPARIWIPPFAEPTNADIHPIIWREQNLIGAAMGWAFDAAGQPGAISRTAFDGYYPGYCTAITDGHNCPSILTEIALYRYATPHFYTLDDFPEGYRDLTPGRFYPTPWKGGWWRLGDAVAYALTASKAVLGVGARYRHEFLMNKFVMGRDAIEKGRSEPPYGWILAPDQHDPGAPSRMLNKLILLGLEVYRAEEAFEDRGVSYPKGTYFVPAGQAFGPYAKEMFKRQDYPDLRKYPHLWQNMVGRPVEGEDPLRPYDASGWTFPLQFGVSYREMSEPHEVAATLVENVPAPEGSVSGSDSSFVFSANDNQSFMAAYALQGKGGKLRRAQDSFTLGGKSYPKGSFIVDARNVSRNDIQEIATRSAVPMAAGSPGVSAKAVGPLRLGLYQSWVASMDEGWMRLVFDEYGCPYTRLTDADVRAGDLKDRFDVIILPDQRAKDTLEGRPTGTAPPQYTGGMTLEGVANLERFVRSGGVLICNNDATELAIDHFNLPVSNAVSRYSPNEFYIAGSILKMDYDTDHPLAFGMPARGVAYYSRARAFQVRPRGGDEEQPGVVARYPDEPLLLSGWIQGGERIRGKPAVLDVPLGEGRVVLFGFNVVNRWQTPAALKLLFNALFYRG